MSVFYVSVLLLIMKRVITLSKRCGSTRRDPHLFDNVMTRFMINKRTDINSLIRVTENTVTFFCISISMSFFVNVSLNCHVSKSSVSCHHDDKRAIRTCTVFPDWVSSKRSRRIQWPSSGWTDRIEHLTWVFLSRRQLRTSTAFERVQRSTYLISYRDTIQLCQPW